MCQVVTQAKADTLSREPHVVWHSQPPWALILRLALKQIWSLETKPREHFTTDKKAKIGKRQLKLQ